MSALAAKLATPPGLDADFAQLAERIDTETFLLEAIRARFAGRIALVSSFGTEAAVLLHLVATIDPGVPVLFIDTDKHFGETLRYRDALARRLGLRNLRDIQPDPREVSRLDPSGDLSTSDPDACCRLRKVEPLQYGLADFDAWINGRKRFQGGLRSAIPLVELAEGKVKLNPLAQWRAEDIDAYIRRHDLPRHPLEASGYSSVGCMPCSGPTPAGERPRAGRWRGRDKDECGIHLPQPALTRGE